MHHHPKFEHSRFIGDKRTQLVYDLDAWDDEATIDEIVKQGVGLSFGPDTLDEARTVGTRWRPRASVECTASREPERPGHGIAPACRTG